MHVTQSQDHRNDNSVQVPDFVGQQALAAWLVGHDLGVLCQGPDPDSPHPVLHGIVTGQQPPAGTSVHRWDTVTVWVEQAPGDLAGVREPRRPLPRGLTTARHRELPMSSLRTSVTVLYLEIGDGSGGLGGDTSARRLGRWLSVNPSIPGSVSRSLSRSRPSNMSAQRWLIVINSRGRP
jgi:hypothetical protein